MRFKGFHWGQQNPTRTALKDVGITYHKVHSTDQGLEKMGRYRTLDPRVTFMSAFPVSIVLSTVCRVNGVRYLLDVPIRFAWSGSGTGVSVRSNVLGFVISHNRSNAFCPSESAPAHSLADFEQPLFPFLPG